MVDEFVPDKILLIPVRFDIWSANSTRRVAQLIRSLFQDAFDEGDCKRFIKFIEGLPLELTPAPRKGEAERVNRTFVPYIEKPLF